MKKPTKIKKPTFDYIIGIDFNEKDAKTAMKASKGGSLQAKLDIILHNQLVLHCQLGKLLNEK